MVALSTNLLNPKHRFTGVSGGVKNTDYLSTHAKPHPNTTVLVGRNPPNLLESGPDLKSTAVNRGYLILKLARLVVGRPSSPGLVVNHDRAVISAAQLFGIPHRLVTRATKRPDNRTTLKLHLPLIVLIYDVVPAFTLQ